YTGRAIDIAPEAESARHLATGFRFPRDGNRLASGGLAVVKQERFDGLLLLTYRHLHVGITLGRYHKLTEPSSPRPECCRSAGQDRQAAINSKIEIRNSKQFQMTKLRKAPNQTP